MKKGPRFRHRGLNGISILPTIVTAKEYKTRIATEYMIVKLEKKTGEEKAGTLERFQEENNLHSNAAPIKPKIQVF